MKNILKLEEAAMFALSIFALSLIETSFSWWVYPLLYLAPDISMVGYWSDNKTGAWLYNIAHSKTLAIIVVTAGLLMGNDIVLISGIILFGHSSMDRMFGFGLKLKEGFKHTHLGVMN